MHSTTTTTAAIAATVSSNVWVLISFFFWTSKKLCNQINCSIDQHHVAKDDIQMITIMSAHKILSISRFSRFLCTNFRSRIYECMCMFTLPNLSFVFEACETKKSIYIYFVSPRIILFTSFGLLAWLRFFFICTHTTCINSISNELVTWWFKWERFFFTYAFVNELYLLYLNRWIGSLLSFYFFLLISSKRGDLDTLDWSTHIHTDDVYKKKLSKSKWKYISHKKRIKRVLIEIFRRFSGTHNWIEILHKTEEWWKMS